MRRRLGSLTALFLWCLAPGAALSVLLAVGVWFISPWTQPRLRPLVDHPVTFGGTPGQATMDARDLRARTRDFESNPLAAVRLHWRYEPEPGLSAETFHLQLGGALELRAGWPADTLYGRVAVSDVLDVVVADNWFPIPHPSPGSEAGSSALALERGVLFLRGQPMAFARGLPVGASRTDHVLLPLGVDLLGAPINAVVATLGLMLAVKFLRVMLHARRCFHGRCGHCGYRRAESLPTERGSAGVAIGAVRSNRRVWRRTAARWVPALAAALLIAPLLTALPLIWLDDDVLGVRSEAVGLAISHGHGRVWAPAHARPLSGVDPAELAAMRSMLPSDADPSARLCQWADDAGVPPQRTWWTFETPTDPEPSEPPEKDPTIGYTTLACTNFGWPRPIIQRAAASTNRRCLIDEAGRPTAKAGVVRWRVRWSDYAADVLWLAPAALPLAWLLLFASSSASAFVWATTRTRSVAPWTCTECGVASRVRTSS